MKITPARSASDGGEIVKLDLLDSLIMISGIREG